MLTDSYRFFAAGVMALTVFLSACTVGPNYTKPTAPLPATYKEASESAGQWKLAQPSDTLPRGPWWEIFADPTLNALVAKVESSNQTLVAAVQRLEQARALARVSVSNYYPILTAGADGNLNRQSNSGHFNFGDPTYSDVKINGNLSYELDLWGRVKRSVESARASAQASEADLKALALALQAETATTYFQLRSLDAQRSLLRRTLEFRREALDLVQKRFEGGVSNELDLSRAKTELATTEAELIALDKMRGELEHALAVLIGEMPGVFRQAEQPLNGLPPIIPVGVPSELLERRPDVAAAERRMAAANAEIGVAKAAYYPVFKIGLNGGYDSVNLGTLLDWPSRMWAIGPSIDLPLFTSGRLKGNVDAKTALYLETIANYRQTVLVASREVEDALTGARVLARQSEAVDRAVAAARKSAELSNIRYKDGLVNYLEVVDSERPALQTEFSLVQLQGQRFATAVLLVRALGGDWLPGQMKTAAAPNPFQKAKIPLR